MSYPSLRPVPARYDDVIADLRTAYDGGVEYRDRADKQPWKLAERDAFRARLAARGVRRRLGFAPGTFDAVYAMNCLLHVPNADLPAVLAQLRAVLRPGGLFFLGLRRCRYRGDRDRGLAHSAQVLLLAHGRAAAGVRSGVLRHP